jgi:hypothetical protein
LDGERKSIEPLASRVPDGNVQAMQQLVGQSPWDWLPIWELLGKRMTAELEPDSVWVIDDTGFPKQGEHSVGVERQYSGTLGKVGNCQVAVSVHHVSEQGHTILGWRLYLPESWAKDRPRREEAGIPPDVKFQTKWQLGLDIIDQVRGWGLADRDRGGRCGVRGCDRVSRRAGNSRPCLYRGNLLELGSMDRAADGGGSSTSLGSRCPGHAPRLWQAASDVGARGGSESKRVEGRSLAARHEGMVGVALRGDAGTAIAWIRPRGTATQKIMVAGGMARVRERTHQILLLRLARKLYPSPVGAFGEVSMEDRAGLSATEGRTWTGSLRRTQLDRLASSHHARYDGARVPNSRNSSAKKKLLGGPCHRRAVRFNIC